MPDMSKVKSSRKQKEQQKKFAEAVAFAKSISRNPVKKAAYAKKLRKGQSVYHAAIQEYYEKNSSC
jgi:homogentisate 1,2-dioxygenase